MKWSLAIGCLAALVLGAKVDAEPKYLSPEARVVAAYSTRTIITLTTTTATGVITCNQAAGTNPCQKRRLRRYRALSEPSAENSDFAALESGLEEDPVLKLDEPSSTSEKGGRIALTVWSTKSTTYTVTSTSIDTGTTLSISYYCTVMDADMFGACG